MYIVRHMYICIYVYMCIHVYTCICIYIYIYIYIAKAKVYHTRNTVDDWFESARYHVGRAK